MVVKNLEECCWVVFIVLFVLLVVNVFDSYFYQSCFILEVIGGSDDGIGKFFVVIELVLCEVGRYVDCKVCLVVVCLVVQVVFDELFEVWCDLVLFEVFLMYVCGYDILWWYWVFVYELVELLCVMCCDVLVMFGGKDLLVDFVQNCQFLEEVLVLSQCEWVYVVILDGFNYLFQYVEIGL